MKKNKQQKKRNKKYRPTYVTGGRVDYSQGGRVSLAHGGPHNPKMDAQRKANNINVYDIRDGDDEFRDGDDEFRGFYYKSYRSSIKTLHS